MSNNGATTSGNKPLLLKPGSRLLQYGRLLRNGSLIGVGGLMLFGLYENDFDVSSFGPVRLGRAGICAIRIIADYKLSFMSFTDKTSQEYLAKRKIVHKRSAEKLLELACANGGVWIKVGQHVGALNYLLPVEYTETLKILHSGAPQSKLTDVYHVIEADLKQPVFSIFSDFDPSPIGTASLAQVHSAVLKTNGERVAIKVQHPRVKPHSLVDTVTMEAIIRIVARLFPEFKLLWLTEEMKRSLPMELNFVMEANTAERVAGMFKSMPFIKVPKIHWLYTTDRVLTMEYCEGGQVNDLNFMKRHKINTQKVVEDLGRMYSEMIFHHGFVHCDPHPGNVLVHPHPKLGHQIVLLDHGLYASLNEQFRFNYANLWMSLLSADVDGIKKWSLEMGVGDLYGLFACMLTARSWETIRKGTVKRKPSDTENAEIQQYVASLLPQITEVIDRVPKPMILILKTNDLVRSIENTLSDKRAHGNGMFGFLEMTRSCVRSLRTYHLNHTTSPIRRFTIHCWAVYNLTRLWFVRMAMQMYWAMLN